MWKTTWRRWARYRTCSSAASRRICEHLDGHLPVHAVVAAFRALPGEPVIDPLVDGRRSWVIPRVSGRQMTFHPWDADLEEVAFGLQQPVAGSTAVDPGDIDVMLVPGLAYDSVGVRLGRGAGYYDRYLAVHRPRSTIGVIAAHSLVERLPRLSHDELVDAIATEAGVRSLSS